MIKYFSAAVALLLVAPAAFAGQSSTVTQALDACCAALDACCEQAMDCCED